MIETIPIKDLASESEDENDYSYRLKQKKLNRSWKREEVCFACNEGPDDHRQFEICVDCPRVFHYECIGLKEMETITSMRCPQHKCCHENEDGSVCLKSSAANGNCLFWCDRCPRSYCWQHLPKDDDWHNSKCKKNNFRKSNFKFIIAALPERLKNVGFVERKTVVFITCYTCRSGSNEKLDSNFYVARCTGNFTSNPCKGWHDRNEQHKRNMVFFKIFC